MSIFNLHKIYFIFLFLIIQFINYKLKCVKKGGSGSNSPLGICSSIGIYTSILSKTKERFQQLILEHKAKIYEGITEVINEYIVEIKLESNKENSEIANINQISTELQAALEGEKENIEKSQYYSKDPHAFDIFGAIKYGHLFEKIVLFGKLKFSISKTEK